MTRKDGPKLLRHGPVRRDACRRSEPKTEPSSSRYSTLTGQVCIYIYVDGSTVCCLVKDAARGTPLPCRFKWVGAFQTRLQGVPRNG